MTELMKQKQFAPMSVADQALVIFAAEQGFLENVALNQVADFEAGLIAHANQIAPELLSTINQSGDYNSDIEAKLRALLEEFSALQV
ncbi:ATP synthase alpha chain [Vibrio maritimus]|uniref:ATP synthase alpha chain n=1 Tax=Vibrio maritimus TaxID=990268 RepID=A0A090TSU9_9VIBR|nr:ATP synthase alpha chain [Vibrio maritimus]